jgi:hypothetical protein
MPYDLSLQSYTLPEFYAQAPISWERRLREISPVTSNLSHLRFRKFEPREDWLFPNRPIWALYACTPRHMVEPMTAAGYEKHWSELPLRPESDFPESEQMAQRAMVSDYQHFMWHTQGVMPRLFWLLQGEWGGTPAKYTARERRYLAASGAVDEPFPIGWFRGCPFDERAVTAIQKRDRLLQSGNNFDALEKTNRTDWKKAEDDAAELVYRETVLDSLAVLNAPAIEFMKSQIAKDEFADAERAGWLPPAPVGLDRTLASFRDVYKETGRMPLVSAASVRTLHPVR